MEQPSELKVCVLKNPCLLVKEFGDDRAYHSSPVYLYFYHAVGSVFIQRIVCAWYPPLTIPPPRSPRTVVWRCSWEGAGALCVTMTSPLQLPTWCAVSWALPWPLTGGTSSREFFLCAAFRNLLFVRCCMSTSRR